MDWTQELRTCSKNCPRFFSGHDCAKWKRKQREIGLCAELTTKD